MSARLAVTALLLLAAAPGAAQDAPLPSPLTAEAAVAFARDHSPLLARAEHGEAAARADLDAARGGRWGVLAATATATRFQDDVVVRPISAEIVGGGFGSFPFDRDQATAGVEAELPLYTGGRLAAAVAAAEARAGGAGEQRAATADEVLAGVHALFARAQATAAAREAAASWVEALEARHRDISALVEVGRAPRLDLARLDADLARARAEAAAAAATHDGALARLLALMGGDPGARATLAALPARRPGPAPALAELRPLALSSPALRASEADLRAASSEAEAARAERRPQLAARGAWNAHDAPSVDGRLETWSVGLALRLRLFDGGAAAGRAAAARAEAEGVAAELEQRRQEALAELEGAAARFEAGRARVDQARAGLEAATAVRDAEQVRYDTGAGPIRDLLEAEAQLATARAALAGATAEVLVEAATLNRICGQEVVR
jgi:outer membrane protein